MEHYICKGGCKGVSDKPGVCGAETCAKHAEPLEACACEDGRHEGAFEKEMNEHQETHGGN